MSEAVKTLRRQLDDISLSSLAELGLRGNGTFIPTPGETMQDQYRLDRAYGKVYEYSDDHRAYLYLCSFCTVGASARNRDKTIVKKIEEWKAIDLITGE